MRVGAPMLPLWVVGILLVPARGDVPMLPLWAGTLLTTVLPARGDISIYNLETREIELQVKDAPSLFGGNIPIDGLRGLLVYANPPDACGPVEPPPKNFGNFFGKWILLIKRNPCSFEKKIRNAQAAGYNAAIVHNVNSSSLQPMGADNTTGIFIPSVFIGSEDGEELKANYLYYSGYYACINHDLPFDITIHMLLIFSILVGVCFLGMVLFIVIKYFKDRRRQQRHRLPKSSLKQIPVHKFKKNDPFDTCVICLEEYVEGEKLRVLPCCHAYHMKCIDPWLTRNRRVCPVCKRKVIAGGPHATDSETESDDETQPLIRGTSGAHTSSDTFVTQPENPFQRARRHFLGVAESVASSISSSSSGTSEHNSEQPAERRCEHQFDRHAHSHSNTHSHSVSHSHTSSIHSVTVDVENNEESRSLVDEPSVNG